MVLEALDTEVQQCIKEIEPRQAEAQSVIAELTGKHKAATEENNLLKLQYLELKERYDLLLFKRFGRAAEQLLRDKNQPLLFDERQGARESDEAGATDTATQEIRAHKRRIAAGRKPIGPAIPREDHIIDLPEAEKKCACGAEMEQIGEEISERLNIDPPRIFVEQIIRPKYACRECEGTEDEDRPVVRIAPAPSSIIPGSIVTPGLLSTILVAKYEDHLPFYWQEKQFERIGVRINRQNMCNFSDAA
jgi:transposase